MHNIQKVIQILLTLFKLILIVFPIILVTSWLFIDTAFMKNLLSSESFFSQFNWTLFCSYEGKNLPEVNWIWSSQIIGFISASVNNLCFFLNIFFLKQVFENYKNGQIFSVINAMHYRKIGLLFFLDALFLKPLSGLLITLAVTFSNPPGQRYISLSVGTPNIEALFYGALIMVISWVMLEASKIHDEQQFTV